MCSEKRINNCSAVKAILMCIIVLYHSTLIYAGGWAPEQALSESVLFKFFGEWLNTFHVYAFTLISGYLFYYLKREKNKYKEYIPFVVNKIKRLLVPYVFIATVWACPVYMYFFGTKNVFSKFVIGTAPAQLWFLLMLFWVFVIFWPISEFADNHVIITGILFSALYFVGMYAPALLCFNRGLQFLLFFYVGFLMRKFENQLEMLYKIPSPVYIAASVGVFMVTKYIRVDSIVITLLVLVINALLRVIGAVGAFVILQKIVCHFSKNNRIIQTLSRHSMTVYLVHQQIMYFIIILFNKIVLPELFVVLCFTSTLLISMLISVCLLKNRFTRFLIGEK